MRFALILAFLCSAFVSTEAAPAGPGGDSSSVHARKSPKARKHRATAKKRATARPAKKSRKVTVAESDAEDADTESTEPTPAPKVETAPVRRGAAVAQATDDEEPPAKPKKR